MTHSGNLAAVCRTWRVRRSAIMASTISFRRAARDDARRGHVY